MGRTLKVAWGSLCVSIVVLTLKVAAYWVTGSIALYSDALETVINVVAEIGALVALWFSEQPADANHPTATTRPNTSVPWSRERSCWSRPSRSGARRGLAGSTRTHRIRHSSVSHSMARAAPSTWYGPWC